MIVPMTDSAVPNLTARRLDAWVARFFAETPEGCVHPEPTDETLTKRFADCVIPPATVYYPQIREGILAKIRQPARMRKPEREKFLLDLFKTAIESGSAGFFNVEEYRWENRPPSKAYAFITEEVEDEGLWWRVTIETMATGLGVIRDAVMREVNDYDGTHQVPHNSKTGQRLYFGGETRRQLLLADSTNGEDGDYDVIGALAVLECALFGGVMYA